MMTLPQLTEHLLRRLREVQQRLGGEATATAATAFAEAVDSMGLVEFVGVVAADCGAKPEVVEQAVNRRFTNVADLAKALSALRVMPRERSTQGAFAFAQESEAPALPAATAWLANWSASWREDGEPSAQADQSLGRPAGWLEQHAGIRSRWRWEDDEEVFGQVVEVVRDCMRGEGWRDLGTLLVTSEAPPVAPGFGAEVHHRLGLPARVPALEVGGACLGFLHALWLGRHLVRPREGVLIVAVESHSRWLRQGVGTRGENAALFGDGVAAGLLTAQSQEEGLPLRDVILGCDGGRPRLVEAGPADGGIVLDMDGPALALRAVTQLTTVVRRLCERNGLSVEDLEGVCVHAGNGRMLPLIARRLNLPEDRVVSTTPFSGNLGSVSLPAALLDLVPENGPIVLAAVGAGLNWGAALFDAPVAG